MLKTRVITALMLLVGFLAALFSLPPPAWAVFAGALIIPAAWEWGKLLKLAPKICALYALAVVAVCASLYSLTLADASTGAEGLTTMIYLGAAVLWMVIVPAWLWRTRVPDSDWLNALTGLLVLVPTWLALVQLHLLSPLLLLMLMSVAWTGHRRVFRRPPLRPAQTGSGD